MNKNSLLAIGLVLPAVVVPFSSHGEGSHQQGLDALVNCRRAIEQVYWSQRSWPAQNQKPKPPLESLVTLSDTHRKTRDYLAMRNTLHTFWGRSIQPQQLQAEMNRMADQSRDPDRLGDLFAALENNPRRIAECLAAPILVERLAREAYNHDDRVHGVLARKLRQLEISNKARIRASGGSLREIVVRRQSSQAELDRIDRQSSLPQTMLLNDEDWRSFESRLERDFVDPSAELRSESRTRLPVGRQSRIIEEHDRFIMLELRSVDDDEIRMVEASWRKRTFDEWWKAQPKVVELPTYKAFDFELPSLDPANCNLNTWTPLPFGSPTERENATSVWTGSEVIVWGGTPFTRTGGRYDPATDTWTPTSTIDAPIGRYDHTAIWTGKEMIIWGGDSPFVQNTGGRYNPTTDSWRPTSTVNGTPLARSDHVAVWTGSEMIVWGVGIGGSRLGDRYNPASDSWAPVASEGAPQSQRRNVAVWSGSEMIVVFSTSSSTEAGRYDPVADNWAPATSPDIPLVTSDATAIWTGTRMIIWGGFVNSANGGIYDPIEDSWEPTSLDGAPSGRSEHVAVWTGSEMIIWGGRRFPSTDFGDGARYDPLNDSWSPMSDLNAPTPRTSHTGVWTGNEMVVWGGSPLTGTGGRYDPATDSWSPTAREGLSPREWHSAVWSGAEMIVWGGLDFSNLERPVPDGVRYDPATFTWNPLPVPENIPDGRYRHTAVWTGTEMIVYGGLSFSQEGGRYNPTTNTWIATAIDENTADVRELHTAVWTGKEMIIYGGLPGGRNAASYDPAGDTWSELPLGNEVTSFGIHRHSAIWDGARMIVWGGRIGSTRLQFGCIYDPVSVGWTETSLENAPSHRYDHSALWTGSEMLIWGGLRPDNSGGRYDPVSDTWMPIPASTEGPLTRAHHASAWTGEEMIIWSGRDEFLSDFPYDDGGRFNPTTGIWTPTATNPEVWPRDRFSDVWTGTEMIISGGRGEFTGPQSASYCGCGTTYPDLDHDGLGDPSGAISSCSVLPNHVSNPSDCDDTNPECGEDCTDSDGDGACVTVDCDDANPMRNPRAEEMCNNLDDDCDGDTDEDSLGTDTDGDSVANACDNCSTTANPNQSNRDRDDEGDACDINDGDIFVRYDVTDTLAWDSELGFDSWNAYRGSLEALKQTGMYTQDPLKQPLASSACELTLPTWADSGSSPTGEVIFYLVTGVASGSEGDLGFDSAGAARPNDHPACM